MCTFIFRYENDTQHSFEHIISVEYSKAGHSVTVNEKDFLSHRFPINTALYLFSDDSCYTVNGNNLSYIEVRKEK